jgi:hypothetical protein
MSLVLKILLAAVVIMFSSFLAGVSNGYDLGANLCRECAEGMPFFNINSVVTAYSRMNTIGSCISVVMLGFMAAQFVRQRVLSHSIALITILSALFLSLAAHSLSSTPPDAADRYYELLVELNSLNSSNVIVITAMLGLQIINTIGTWLQDDWVSERDE